ncbi:hypothetical protein VB735_18905 [Halotia wernerae UHCC 0503]|nr:hypothetical protein [Halotia wernerae UHCC 0503]
MVIQNEESVKLPPLENGDRLTRDEFELRYSSTIPIKIIRTGKMPIL